MKENKFIFKSKLCVLETEKNCEIDSNEKRGMEEVV